MTIEDEGVWPVKGIAREGWAETPGASLIGRKDEQ